MSSYSRVFSRPYKVYTGVTTSYDGIEFTYSKSFNLESDAIAYAERMSEDCEFVKIVKIEKKESN